MQEEYRLPGGFVYGLNMVMGADKPIEGPGNGVSAGTVDIVTLLIWAPIIYFWCPPIFIAFFALFALLEGTMHTMFGIIAYNKLHKKGKDTIYFPGNATAWFLFLPAGITCMYELINGGMLTGSQWTITAVIMFVFVVAILALEQALAKVGNNVVYRIRPVEGYFKAFIVK